MANTRDESRRLPSLINSSKTSDRNTSHAPVSFDEEHDGSSETHLVSEAVDTQAINNPQEPEFEPPPDGGLLAWTQVLMGHLVLFNTWGFFTAFGVFATYYENTLGFAPGSLSWIGGAQTFLIFFVGAVSGRALDGGYFRHTQVLGSLLQMLGIFGMSFAYKYWQLFLSHGVCIGLAGGIVFPPTMAVVSTYFSRKRTLALATSSCGSATGGIVFPLLVSHLLPKIGFGWTVRVVGFIQLVVYIITFTFLRTRIIPRKSQPLVDWVAFREAPFVLLCCGMFLNFLAVFWTLFFIGTYARNHIGLSYADSVNFLITINCVGIVGRLILAHLADIKFGPINSMFPMGIITGALVFAWIAVKSETTLYVFAAFYGFASPVPQGLFPPSMSSLTQDLTKIGTRMGMGFTFVSFATLVGPPIGGALIEEGHGDYTHAQIWCGTTLIVGGLTMLAARLAKTGLKLFVWA